MSGSAKRIFVSDYLRGLIYLSHSLVGVIRDADSRAEEREFARDRLEQIKREMDLAEELVATTSGNEPQVVGRLRHLRWIVETRLGSEEERRRRPRVAVQLPVEVLMGGRPVAALCENISLCGMLVLLPVDHAPAVGECVGIRCSFVNACGEQSREITLSAEVVYLKPAVDAAQVQLGLDYTAIHGDELFYLEEYIECHLGQEPL